MESQPNSTHWLNRPLLKNPSQLLSIENLLVFLIVALAIASRFILVGERVMSHDEVNHVVPSYDLFQGRGYRHDPVTHGPFQFHVVALSYFLFGDSDTSSRLPAATFSTLAVIFVLFSYRRFLGRSGALIAGFLFVISPYMLFYGRYTRNEAFIELLGVIMLYAMLRYLESGSRFSMLLFTFSVVMHFTVKETSFIYTAQALIFLAIVFLVEARRILRDKPERYNRFLILLSVAMLCVILALAVAVVKTTPTPEAAAAADAAETVKKGLTPLQQAEELVLLAGALAAGLAALFSLAKDIGWNQIKGLRSFSLMAVTGSLILPMLSPFPVNMLGWNPLDYNSPDSIGRTAIFVALFFLIGIALGWWWNPRQWIVNALLFYSIFTVFYTTFFTNGFGFFTGIVGSLGYWLSQQGVERGSQPWYYYLFQVSIYEYLPAIGTLLAAYFAVRYNRIFQRSGFAPAQPEAAASMMGFPAEANPAGESEPAGAAERSPEQMAVIEALPEVIDQLYNKGADVAVLEHSGGTDIFIKDDAESPNDSLLGMIPQDLAPTPDLDAMYARPQSLPVIALLVFWSLTSLLAYSVAGEKMPWLTVHVTLPMLLGCGWGLGFLVDRIDWKRLSTLSGLLSLLLLPVVFASLSGALSPLLVGPQPFQGNTLDQLQATSRFIVSVIAVIASTGGILYLLRDWRSSQLVSLAAVTFFAVLAVLTGRAAYMASFINYDKATEYLVYAHAARGPKDILAQVEEISRRTTGDKSIKVAYSNDGLYPYWWYFRDYPNKFWFQDKPTRELRDYPIIIAGEDVFNKIDAVVGSNYIRYDYMRLWWPNQDYFNLTWDRIWGAVNDPKMRAAVFNIWLNRDYSEYAKLTQKETLFTPEGWSPGAKIRLYIRKDIVASIWNYGASPSTTGVVETDPYLAKIIDLQAVQVLGGSGAEPGRFNAPRGIKIGPDGSIYVADSRNHRIQHLSPTGEVLQSWGSFADRSQGAAPGGTFNEPWDIAVAQDGSVFVSDTWNHRIQKFTADGQFVKEWGYFGQGEAPDAFWGPRGLDIDPQGHLYVMDTGNNRVVIFDQEGNFISQFGEAGLDAGQFSEPVDLAIDPKNGNVFITDAWNLRIQEFTPSAGVEIFTPVASWDIAGWAGQSLDNKPYIAISPTTGNLLVTDPEMPRVLEFQQDGTFVRGWGQFSTTTDGFGLASGVAVSPEGDVWVSDGANNFLLRFILPK